MMVKESLGRPRKTTTKSKRRHPPFRPSLSLSRSIAPACALSHIPFSRPVFVCLVAWFGNAVNAVPHFNFILWYVFVRFFLTRANSNGVDAYVVCAYFI